jgi:hypothetical protein
VNPTRCFVNPHSPEIHRSASVAPEVEEATVRRPDRSPVGRRVGGDGYRVVVFAPTIRADRHDVTRACLAMCPSRDALPVRRPPGLDRVESGDPFLLSSIQVRDPDLTPSSLTELRVTHGLGCEHKRMAIG